VRKLLLVPSGLVLAGIVAMSLSLTRGAQPSNAAQLTPSTGAGLTAVPQSTWQTNAPVRALAINKGLAWVGGEFTKVRPPGAPAGDREVTRSYLAVLNASTGALNSFNATVNGKVWSIARNDTGSRVFIGGDFTTVNGQPRTRIAAFDGTTGQLVANFRPSVDWRVKTMAARGNTLYIGGSFNHVKGIVRTRLAALRIDNGDLLNWTPAADWDVNAIDIADNGSRVLVGGGFAKINGTNRWALASLGPFPNSGALQAYLGAGAMPNPTDTCVSRVKDIEAVGDRIYVAAGGDGAGCFDGTFATEVGGLGKVVWKNYCLGATESVTVVRGWLFKGSHAHDCSKSGDFPEGLGNHYLLLQHLNTGRLGPWFPNTDTGPPTKVGPLTSATDGTNLWVGGDFFKVQGAGQQGLTRFNASGPGARPGTPAAPTVSSTVAGRVDIRFPTVLDLDDTTLTYRIKRFSVGQLLASRTATSTFWSKPTVSVSDPTLPSGTKVAYRIEVTDGNHTVSGPFSPVVTVR
jgi:hypothetical protein